MYFLDKVAIVTGASSGIGATIAKDLAKQGANITIVGRNEEKLNKVADEITVSTGRKPLLVIADITNDEAAKGIIDKTVANFGKLDILVNNAGFGVIADIISEGIIEIFDSVMKTNIRAVFVLTHFAAPHLIKTKGNIVNISSVTSTVALKKHFAYCTAKAAVDHFSRCMALNLADHGVRVNTVNPGPVKTDFFVNLGMDDAKSAQIIEGMRRDLPLQRVSDSEEISELVLFLASDRARGITGSNYIIDNGQRFNPPKF